VVLVEGEPDKLKKTWSKVYSVTGITSMGASIVLSQA